MKILALILTLSMGSLLVYGASDLPDARDPNSPASTRLSPHFIEKVIEETAVPNMVTAVLADYRGYDTLGETTVIFTGGIACLLILRRRKRKEDEQ